MRRALLAVDVGVKLATVGLLAWAVLNPELPRFQGKAFAGRAIAYPVALLVIPIGWWLFGRRRIPFPVAADLLFGRSDRRRLRGRCERHRAV